jgi:hypothetical protein
MKLWQRLWLLFTVIWVVVAALNIVSILAFGDEEVPPQKALWPLFFAFVVPAAVYLVGWAWDRWKNRGQSPN